MILKRKHMTNAALSRYWPTNSGLRPEISLRFCLIEGLYTGD